jgi:hypothetical protein
MNFETKDKVISVSLYGSKKKYIAGSLKFVTSAQKHLPDWGIVFFVGGSVPEPHVKKLNSLGANTISIVEPESFSAMSWRFRTWQLGNPGWVIFRDADSVISFREANAIRQWVSSERIGHIIRDHPFHSAPIMGGLWGIRPAYTEWLKKEVQDFVFTENYGTDQEFLAKVVYPRIAGSRLVHASFHLHEQESDLAEFQGRNARFGSFCGESVTSSFTTRVYGRLRRLLDPRKCNCAR